jgi:hypothetical protein
MKDIATRRPADKTAARVVSAGPKGYESAKRIVQTCSPTPPQMRDLPAGYPDLRGVTHGHLTVVGLSVRKKGDGTGLWVCRCTCGYFVERRTAVLRRACAITDRGADRCDRCRQVAYLRRASTRQQLGYHPDEGNPWR